LIHLTGKTILVISPAEWGEVMVSKHHYAMELVHAGNRVLYLNPPLGAGNRIGVDAVHEMAGLELVTFTPRTPLRLRFHARRLYDFLMRRDIRRLMKTLATPVDLVWCFDPNLYSDLRVFGGSFNIFHPVDEIRERHQAEVAKSADLGLCVSESIRRTLLRAQPNSHKIGHGLARPFAVNAVAEIARLGDAVQSAGALPAPLRVGYVGNLRIPGLDRTTLRTIIESHPRIIFEFWGPFTNSTSSESIDEVDAFIQFLSMAENVELHGPRTPDAVAAQFGRCDAFIVCYDRHVEPNQGSNAHKILEYLSTGKVVISSHVSEYAGRHGILEMPAADDPPDTFVAVFDNTISALQTLNSDARRIARLRLALDNTYEKQLERIDSLISRTVESRRCGRDGLSL
jgi:hypothetical protein